MSSRLCENELNAKPAAAVARLPWPAARFKEPGQTGVA